MDGGALFDILTRVMPTVIGSDLLLLELFMILSWASEITDFHSIKTKCLYHLKSSRSLSQYIEYDD